MTVSLGFGRPITRLDALQAWWTFDEGTGTVVNDYLGRFSGNFESDGSADVTFDTGKFGTALRFPQNAWVETNAMSSALRIDGNKPRTISFWMYVENGQKNQAGVYGIGRRACPNGLTSFGQSVPSGMATIGVFVPSTGVGIRTYTPMRVSGTNGLTWLTFTPEPTSRSA